MSLTDVLYLQVTPVNMGSQNSEGEGGGFQGRVWAKIEGHPPLDA